jgi:hypothetical protein
MRDSRIELYPKSVDLHRPELIVGGAEQALASLAVVGIERVELVCGAVLLQGLLAVAFAPQGAAEKVMGARVMLKKAIVARRLSPKHSTVDTWLLPE